ncbi:aspartic proteinase CDR1-like [Rosa rugosa]|uniref:aspartic proteinase CDR1-like n=1 Tax=Rosa rugosa TaxID=74645 RepID=UPI002B40F6CE|nr:aspartic proteinase CDR1-like [Rosa rugosa]
MAVLCPLHKNNYTMAVITLFFFHLIYNSATVATNINGGFSAHLIQKNSPNSPLHQHKNNKFFRRLMGPDTPGSPMQFDAGSGSHIMKFSMGTPLFDIYAIVDTGSDLLWTQCQPCQGCYKSNFGVFDPRKSSTHKNITCRSRDCRLLDSLYVYDYCIQKPTGNCVYSYEYLDGTGSMGLLGKETVTLTSTTGKVVALKDIIFGCGYQNNESISSGNIMGMIGLGRGPLSLISQISPYVGGKRFSYCLVQDPKIQSKIYFGNGSEVLGEGVVTTPMVDIEPNENSYLVTVLGITIENEFLSFNSTGTLLNKGNMNVDSGTSTSRLPQDFFDRMVSQLKKVVKLESFIYTKDMMSLLCFNSTTPPKLTPMVFHFEGGSKLPVAMDELFSEEMPGAFCLGISNITNGHQGYFGGSLQTNLLIGFDSDKKVISFKPTNCADFNKN